MQSISCHVCLLYVKCCALLETMFPRGLGTSDYCKMGIFIGCLGLGLSSFGYISSLVQGLPIRTLLPAPTLALPAPRGQHEHPAALPAFALLPPAAGHATEGLPAGEGVSTVLNFCEPGGDRKSVQDSSEICQCLGALLHTSKVQVIRQMSASKLQPEKGASKVF